MLYDFDLVKRWVDSAKRKFIGLVLFTVIIMIIGFALILLKINNNVTFISMIGESICVFSLFAICKKFHPAILFSKSLKGVNIKEHEYVIERASGLYGRRRLVPRGEYRNYKRGPLLIGTTVYIKSENESVHGVGGLRSFHVDIYEDKDVLYKAAGVRYPIVLNREVKSQPCPICGEINFCEQTECKKCGLSVIRGTELPIYMENN
jgi:hypothetical protein